MDTIKSDHELNKYVGGVADEILEELADSGLLVWSRGYGAYTGAGGDWYDRADELAHEAADGSEHVIYTHKAHALCQHCDTYRGEEFVEDCGVATGSYDELASRIAYGELRHRIWLAIRRDVSLDSHHPDFDSVGEG